MLNTITHGRPTNATPLLIAHGLFGSARNWNVIAKRLSEGREVLALDMRNHGNSPRYETNSYRDMAEDLASSLNAPSDVLGHSMGGKAAMALALTRPDSVRKLVVADIAPVAYGHTQLPLVHAMKGLDLENVETRRDADQALAPNIPDPSTRAFLLQSLDVKNKRWLLNLDVLGREMDKIVGWPEIDGQFEGPTLFLSGGASDYVTQESRTRSQALFPNAIFAKIPGAGHWLHAEKPREFEAAVDAFLKA